MTTPKTTASTITPRRGGLERRSIDWIPPDERKGKSRDQGPFWFLTNFHPFTVALGLVGPSLGLSLSWTILAATIGVLFGTIFLALHGSQGPALGLPQMIQSRAQLGYRGVIVILFASLFTFIAYNVVDIVLIDAGSHTLFGWNATATGLGIGMVAVVLAVWGHDWLHRAFRLLFWLSLPLWLILTYGTITGAAGGQANPALGFNLAAFVTVFTIAASYNITYAPIVSDYTRYLAQRVSSAPADLHRLLGRLLVRDLDDRPRRLVGRTIRGDRHPGRDSRRHQRRHPGGWVGSGHHRMLGDRGDHGPQHFTAPHSPS